MPVYEGPEYRGLLTTNTIARWLADQMQRHDGMCESEPVSAALAVAEADLEIVLHRPRNLTVPQTIWEFTTSARHGKPVTALIITTNGKKNETPLGIVVAEDLARLPD